MVINDYSILHQQKRKVTLRILRRHTYPADIYIAEYNNVTYAAWYIGLQIEYYTPLTPAALRLHKTGPCVEEGFLSQPKFNQQLSSTEFEVRLHSYPVIHPPHTNSLLLLLTAPARQVGRLYN